MVLPTFPLPCCQAPASARFQKCAKLSRHCRRLVRRLLAPLLHSLTPFSFGTLPPRLIAILNFIRILIRILVLILIRFVVFLAVAIDFL